MRLFFGVVLLQLSFPQFVRADVGPPPGFSRVPRHLLIEVDREYSDYRFWLVSVRGSEPLELTPGKPCRIDGQGRTGSHRSAYVVAVRADVAQHWRPPGPWEGIPYDPSGRILHSKEIDFDGSVPFYDSRREIIDTYRLELVPDQQVSLVCVGQNEGSRWVKTSWAAAGLFVAAGVVWVGYQPFRRRPPSRPADPHAAPDRG
jgi:hypothetical protein